MSSMTDVLQSSLSTSSPTLYLAVAAVLAIVYWSTRWSTSHRDWRQYGVKCPSLPDYKLFEDNIRFYISDILNKYGDTVGIYDSSSLILLTANLDLWRNILIKDFSNFVDRDLQIISSSPVFKSLFFAPATEWRRHRRILSPTFTTGKLKYISKSIDKSAKDLTDYLAFASKDTPVSIKEICGRFTSEIIAKTAFGINAKFIGEDEVEFYEYSKNMFMSNVRKGISRIVFNILLKVPFLRELCIKVFNLQYFDPANLKSNKYFNVVVREAIAEKSQQQKNGVEKAVPDFLDLLLKANNEAATGKLEASEEIFQNQHQSEASNPVQGFTDEDMVGQCMLVIFAGMETTATTLQMCLYELAANPDVQEKVFQEIASVTGESPTPEELNSLSYTEQVINETLRLYPPAPTVGRTAKETRTYNGVTIPKGTAVIIPYYYVMKDPKIFPDPEKFDPNRFSPEEKEKRDPIAFSPFGQGPRLCLGMRLAYMELKHGLVHILRKLRVVLNDKTEPKIGAEGVKFTESRLVIPTKPITLAFELRESLQRECI